MIETPARSIAKALSWRTLGSLTTACLTWAVTRNLELAVLVGGIDTVAKIGLFFVHERAWNRIPFGKSRQSARVIWMTGLPAAGKTTLAAALKAELERRRIPVEHLDGDEIRNLFPHTGFDRVARDQHIRRVGHLASRLEAHGVWVIVSMVSPYRESRDFVRGVCRNFVEVHVNTPLDVCQQRDPKGLYRKAREGKILDLTGVQSDFEAPLDPEIRIDTSVSDLDACVHQVIDGISGKPRASRAVASLFGGSLSPGRAPGSAS